MSELSDELQDSSSREARGPFSGVHFLYAIAFLTSSIVTFGTSGIVLGLLILGAWAFIYVSRSRPKALAIVSTIVVGFNCCLFGWLESSTTPPEITRRWACKNNLRQIGLALYTYHEVYDTFPPAYVADENGRPMHSWRVLILPYIEEESLYEKYDFNEPWDGPHNSRLLTRMPFLYECPSAIRNRKEASSYTSYLAVVGPRTAWPGPVGRGLREFQDGVSNTILVVETNSSEVPWMKPYDPGLEDVIRTMTSPVPPTIGGHRFESFFYEYDTGRHVLYVDGLVEFVSHGIDREIWSTLFTVDDGRGRDDYDFQSPFAETEQLKLGNCVRFAVFLILALFPLPWVWITPRKPDSTSTRDGPQPGI